MAEAHAVASALVFRALLPPHPAFSLGERENRPSLRGESNTLGRASVSALNRGANGASVVEFIRGSQTNRCFERAFPLTPPSPSGRGSVARRAFANPERLDLSPRGMRYSLSLRERVRVRGNGTPPTETPRRLLQAQIDWLAEAGLAIISSPEPVDGRRARGRKRTGVSSMPSPSPRPLPWGEGAWLDALPPIQSASTCRRAGCAIPSPGGRGPG